MLGSSTILSSKKIKYDIYTVLAFNAPFVSQSWPRGKGQEVGESDFFFYAGLTLCRVDIVSRMDHCYRPSLGPTLLPIVVVCIVAALIHEL